MLKKISVVILMVAMLLSLTACGNADENKGEFLSYTDGYGDVTVLETKPEKIISLSPNITEVLCDLGLESKIIGRTDYCDYPETIISIESVGDISAPNMELIISLKPDVVITDGMQQKEFVYSLRNVGIKVICLRANASLEGTYEIIEDAGKITGTEEKANVIISEMKAEIVSLKERVKDVEKKKVYYSISNYGGLYTSGAGTYIDELLKTAGLINIAEDMEGWTYSLEKLYENNPEIIICSMYYNAKDDLINDETLKDLTAIKEGKIIEIDNNQLDRQSKRNVDGIKELIEKIYE